MIRRIFFKKIVKPKETKVHIGVFFPLWVHSYILLFSIAERTTITALFKKIIYDWHEKNKETFSEEVLINKIVNRVELEFAKQSSKKRKPCDYQTFIQNIEKELVYRRVHPAYIKLIMMKL